VAFVTEFVNLKAFLPKSGPDNGLRTFPGCQGYISGGRVSELRSQGQAMIAMMKKLSAMRRNLAEI
jgi:hypothetical protein